MTPGTTYKFQVTASNEVGDSVVSPRLTVKAAQRPDAPSQPVSLSQEVESLQFGWSMPNDNYDTIIDYKVYWDQGEQGLVLFYVLSETTYGDF